MSGFVYKVDPKCFRLLRIRKMKVYPTLIKKKIKFSSYIRKFRVEQLQRKGFLIHEEMRKYFP